MKTAVLMEFRESRFNSAAIFALMKDLIFRRMYNVAPTRLHPLWSAETLEDNRHPSFRLDDGNPACCAGSRVLCAHA